MNRALKLQGYQSSSSRISLHCFPTYGVNNCHLTVFPLACIRCELTVSAVCQTPQDKRQREEETHLHIKKTVVCCGGWGRLRPHCAGVSYPDMRGRQGAPAGLLPRWRREQTSPWSACLVLFHPAPTSQTFSKASVHRTRDTKKE